MVGSGFLFNCFLLNFLEKATELCILAFTSHLESRAVDGTGIVGTGITKEKKKKKLTERMAENLHLMVKNLLCQFVMSFENDIVVATLCLNGVCFVFSFILTKVNVLLCMIKQGFYGCVLSNSEVVGLVPAVCMNVQQPVLIRLD